MYLLIWTSCFFCGFSAKVTCTCLAKRKNEEIKYFLSHKNRHLSHFWWDSGLNRSKPAWLVGQQEDFNNWFFYSFWMISYYTVQMSRKISKKCLYYTSQLNFHVQSDEGREGHPHLFYLWPSDNDTKRDLQHALTPM